MIISEQTIKKPNTKTFKDENNYANSLANWNSSFH